MATDMVWRDAAPDETVDHGGNLIQARALFPDAVEPWIDLSTGINPHPYPLFDLPATAFTRLPELLRLEELRAAAARAYGAPSPASVCVTPGLQMLLPILYGLAAPGRAVILGPTYAEHRRTARAVGHTVLETDHATKLEEADLAILVNPNNPDGRIVDRTRLLALAATLRRRNGLLIVDESFMDVTDGSASLAGDTAAEGVVVLRSIGKFFGLAGIRLGFGISAPAFAARLSSKLGPWAVSGPAIEIGVRALGDAAWRTDTMRRLADSASRLEKLLARHGLRSSGGTNLFGFVRDARAPALFQVLGRAGIFARRFPERRSELRIGLPGPEQEWRRLADALECLKTAEIQER